MKIYSGIEDADRNIPWIDDETGEEGADKDGSTTLNLTYGRVKLDRDLMKQLSMPPGDDE